MQDAPNVRVVITEYRPDVTHANRQGYSLLYIPGFTREEDFYDQYCRMLWYVQPMLADVAGIFYATSFTPPTGFKIPRYLDPAISGLAGPFKGKVRRFSFDDVEVWSRLIKQADIIMHWDITSLHPDPRIARVIEAGMKKKRIYRVDKNNFQFDGSISVFLSHDTNKHFDSDLNKCKLKFDKMMDELAENRKGYVFGTGPSLGRVLGMDLSDGLSIACNSMVRNETLLSKLQPKIFVVGDAVFNAGCSSYAGKFRRHLCDLLDRYGCYFLVPFRDYRIYMTHLPVRFRDRIIGIPFRHMDHVNLDLSTEFVITTTSNILTAFLIPLACTLFKEVGIAGCDGRKLEDDSYFWSHHKESQLTEEMENIKLAHPGFFRLVDYNDYYLEHCTTLERWLVAGEEKGIVFSNLTPSYIPALQKRTIPSPPIGS